MAPKNFSKKLLRAGQTSVYTNPRSARERKQTRTTAWGVSSVWLERRPVTSEVAGSSPVLPANGAINEDMASLDELLNQLVDTDDAEEAKDNDEE